MEAKSQTNNSIISFEIIKKSLNDLEGLTKSQLNIDKDKIIDNRILKKDRILI